MGTRIWTPGDGLGSIIKTSVNNNGSAIDTGIQMELDAPAVVADAAIAYYDEVNPDRTKTWTHKLRARVPDLPVSAAIHSLRSIASGNPTVDTAVNVNNTLALLFYMAQQGGTFELYIGYRDAGGTFRYWRDNNSTWQTSFTKGVTSFTGVIGTKYVFITECDGINFDLTIKNADQTSTLWGPATIAVTSPDDNGTDWFTWGEAYTDAYPDVQMYVDYMEYTGPEISGVKRIKRSDIQGNSRFTRGGLLNA